MLSLTDDGDPPSGYRWVLGWADAAESMNSRNPEVGRAYSGIMGTWRCKTSVAL